MESRNCRRSFLMGENLTRAFPWFARWSARMHFKWLRKSQSPLAFLEAAIAITFALLGRARDGASVLGPVFDARGFARHDAAHPACRRRHRRRHELPENGRKSVWITIAPRLTCQTEAFQQEELSLPLRACAAGDRTPSFPSLDRHVSGSAARLSRHATVACFRNQVVGARYSLDLWLQPVCTTDRSRSLDEASRLDGTRRRNRTMSKGPTSIGSSCATSRRMARFL